jgi:hypothetical protein
MTDDHEFKAWLASVPPDINSNQFQLTANSADYDRITPAARLLTSNR